MAELGPSEFEGKGARRSGEMNLSDAHHRARYERRVEKEHDDPTASVDDKAEQFEHGGIPESTGKDWWIIR